MMEVDITRRSFLGGALAVTCVSAVVPIEDLPAQLFDELTHMFSFPPIPGTKNSLE
mgnify:CR=1 FL=1